MCRRAWVVVGPSDFNCLLWKHIKILALNAQSWDLTGAPAHIYQCLSYTFVFTLSFIIFFCFNWFFLMIENKSIIELAHKKSAWTFIETQILLLLVYKICELVSFLLLTFKSVETDCCLSCPRSQKPPSTDAEITTQCRPLTPVPAKSSINYANSCRCM